MLKKIGLGIGLIIAIIGAFMAFATASFEPAGLASAAKINIAAAPAIDTPSAARRLGEAIQFQTISHQSSAENKVEEWTKFQSWLRQTYPLSHAAMVRVPLDGQTMLFHWAGSDAAAKPIILMAHQDVVPVTAGTEKDWKHPPFGGVIAENAVWGRGAVDDKGSLIALFEAIEALRAQGFTPKRSIYLVSGDDEEVGGKGAQKAAAWLASKGVKALFTLDEGSAVIADAPVINGPAALIGVAEKGYATMRVTAKAVGGHSSMPPTELGTINLAKAVLAINDRQFPTELRPPASTMIEALAAKKGGFVKVAAANQWLLGGQIKSKFGETPSGKAMLHTTIAPTMLQGSPKENVLPQSANALINFRIAPWQNSAAVMAHVQKSVAGMPVELAWDSPPREPSPVSSTTSQGWAMLRAVVEAESPQAVVAPYLVVGATDSRSMVGVSDDIYRFMPAMISIKETAMIHGTNEHITLDNLGRMIRFYTRLIAGAAG